MSALSVCSELGLRWPLHDRYLVRPSARGNVLFVLYLYQVRRVFGSADDRGIPQMSESIIWHRPDPNRENIVKFITNFPLHTNKKFLC